MKKTVKKVISVLLCLATLITVVPFSALFISAQAATVDYNDPLIARVAEYCSQITTDELTSKLNSGVWDLNNVDDYNEFVSMYNELQETNKERWDLLWLTNNEVFTAWQFKEHISQSHIRVALGLSGLVFNGEAIGYITGEWAEKEKYKVALEKYMEANCDEVLETTFIDETINILQDLSEEVADPLRKAHIKELKKNVGNAVTSEHVKTLLYEFHFEGDKYLVDVADVKNNQLADAFGIAGDVVDLVDVTANGICNLVNVSSNLKVYELYGDFLDEIANDYNLPVALRCAANELSQSLAEQYLQAVTEIGADFMQFAADKCISLAAEQFGSVAVSTALQSVLLGISIGKFIGNVILGVDELIKSSAYVECYAILAEKYQSMVLQDKESFISTPNRENAVKFRDDYKILQQLRLIGEQTYIDMQGGKGTEAANKAIRSMTGYEDKKAFCDDNIEKTISCAFSMFAGSTAEKLLPYRTTYSETVVIACPVDVNVYDSDNNLVAKVNDNVIDETVTDTSEYPVIVYVDDDVKTIRMTDTDKYRIEIEAFDSGEMTYSAYTYSEDYELVSMAEYAPVEITSGDEFEVNPQMVEDASYQNLYTSSLEELKPEKTYQKENLPETKDDIADVVVAEELFEGFSTELIDKIANAMFKFESVVDIASYNISTDDTVALFSAISKYYPTEYSLLTKSDFDYKIIFSPSLGCITDIRFYYGDDANLEAFEQRNKDLKAEIDKIVAQVEGMDDFEKALYIHDYIVLNSEYDLELLEILETEGTLTGELRSERYTEYSILINGTGICGSYALAYRALMNAAGVDCLYLSSQQMNHAWNMVKIDGEWYHVDCCWDDPVPDTYGRARRTYFLRTDAEIMELNHYSWTPGQYKATSEKYSEMPRNYDIKQKYDEASDSWYYLSGTTLYSADEYGKNESELGSISASSIDYDNDTLYFSKGRYVCTYNTETSEIDYVYFLSNSDSGDDVNKAYISNIYVDGENISYYKSVYDNRSITLYDEDLLQTEKFNSITGISLDRSEIIMDIFDETELIAKISGNSKIDDLDFVWSSSDDSVVSVDENGKIKALNVGEATITIKMLDYSANCVVNVSGTGFVGTGGNDIIWEYDCDSNIINFSGTGQMTNFESADEVPWNHLKKGIKKIIISEGITTIGFSAFKDCINLTEVLMPNSISAFGNDIFVGCTSLTSITIPSGITTISTFAFANCSSLQEIIIPDSVIAINGSAFANCTSLETISLPNSITDIYHAAFHNCTNLKTIDLSDNLNYLGGSVFEGCSSLKSVILPDGISSIDDFTFFNCSSLINVNVPDSVTSIGYGAFANCVVLEDVVFGDSLYTIGQHAFENCKSIKIINLSDNVETIDFGAFAYCSSLLSVSLGSNTKWIAESAFEGNTSLISIVIPESISSIGSNAFNLCSNLLHIGYCGDESNIVNIYIGENNSCLTTAKYIHYNFEPQTDITRLDKIIATCTETGHSDANYCLTCKCYLDGAVYPSTGEHNYQIVSTTPGSCTTAATYTYTCSSCGDSYTKEGKAEEGHSYTETETAPTCTEIGYTTATCELCGENAMYDFVPMLGHDVTVTHTDADCKKCARTEYSCSRCDYHEIIVDEESGLGEHKISVTVTEATCTENGSIDRICVTCNELISTEVVASNGHIPGEWETSTDATTESAGKKEKRCIVCKELVEEEEIPKIPVNVSGVALSENEIEISNKETYLLSATVSPENADDRTVMWISDDSSVATVDKNGLVTAVSIGETTVSVTTTDGGYTASCTVTVIPREFDITWVVGGHETVETYKEGSLLKKPSDPVKTGYTFTGWTPEVPDIMPAEDLTFTATWKANSYDAVFDANGGKWSDGSTKSTVITEYNAEIVVPEAPEKQGYIFSGWTPEVCIMDNVNGKAFKAVWIASTDTTYIVETHTMNTLGEYEKTIQTFNVATDSSVNAEYEVKKGFVLNKEKSVLTGTVAADNSLVLKVYLDRNTYSFTTIIDGVSESTEYLYGSIIAEPAVPEKTGYTFAGWKGELLSTMPAEDITIEAEWNVNSYTVTWIVDGTETVTTVEYGTKIEIPATPTKSGYKFIKWNGTIPQTMPAENITVTAVFEKRYVCPDCGKEILGEDAINKHIASETKVNITSGTVVSGIVAPGATITIKAEQIDGKIFSHWEVTGATIANANSAETTIVLGSGKIIITAVYDDCDCKCHQVGIVGFFFKIVLFFQKLFGNNLVCICGAKH